MSITATRIDGQNIGLRIDSPDTSVDVLTVNLTTGLVTSDYLSTTDKQILQQAALDLFELVPLSERSTGALGFLQRLVSVAAADNSIVTPSAYVAGGAASLIVSVATTPANIVIHVPYSAEGTVAWATGISGVSASSVVNSISALEPVLVNLAVPSIPVISLASNPSIEGTFGSATQVAQVDVDDHGLITSAANVSIAFPVTSVSGSAAIDVSGSPAAVVSLNDTIGGPGPGGAGSYGTVASASESIMPTFTVDAQGRLTAVGQGAIQIGGLAAKTYVDNQDTSTLNSANAYAQSLSYGLSSKLSVHAATVTDFDTLIGSPSSYIATTLTLTGSVDGAFPLIDGESIVVGERVLVKDEFSTNAPNNGIYVLTQLGDGSSPWILTRTDDANSAAELCGSLVPVQMGSVNKGTVWLFAQNPASFTLGSTDVFFTQVTVPVATNSVLGIVQLAGGLGGGGTAYSPRLDVSSANVGSGVLDVIRGGTGLDTYVTGDLLVAFDPNTLDVIPAGAVGTVLKGFGVGVQPGYSAVSLTADVSGTLPIINGGTNTSTVPANGELLIGNGTDYTVAGLTASSGISVTPGAGSISIANTGVLDITTPDSFLSTSGGQNPQITFTGVLDALHGGTGSSSTPAAGQVLIGNGTAYEASYLTAGDGIQVINEAGAITITQNGTVSDTFTTGSAIPAGAVCYIGNSDGKVYAAAANVESTSHVVGVALESVAGPDLPIILATFNRANVFSGLATGNEYFLSSTGNGQVVLYSTLAAVSGVQIVSLGYARSATELQLNIQRRGTTP